MGPVATCAAAVSVVLLLGACSSPLDGSSVADPGSPTTGSPATGSSSGTSSPSPTESDSGSPAGFAASVHRIGPRLRDQMLPSHRTGCPVPLADLRYLRVTYVGFGGRERTGELVLHKDYAEGVRHVFETLYDARWPIRRMRLVDDYQGDDDRSMAANNTSAYNCRPVAGTGRWSKHAFGAAIDINPVQNPYVSADSVDPPAGQRFATLDRSRGTQLPAGAIHAGDVVVEAFARIGWGWGGDWSGSKDYQHFSAEGG